MAGGDGVDPYALRAKGLSEPLTPHELGRALYHLSKRRHFKERDLVEIGESETAPDNEEAAPAKPRGKAKAAPKDGEPNDETKSTEARKHFVAELNASGQTLGQALAARAPDAKRRGEHATRAIVKEEFLRLVAAQAPYHAVLRDAAFHGAVEEAIFAQRPVFWRKSTLGKCALMPGEPLCPKGSWLSQERRMLEKVNNLAIVGGNARRLDEEERGAILAALRTQKTLSWPGVRRVLEPNFKARGESAKTLRFNLEAGDQEGGLKGNIVEADLAKIFGTCWNSHPLKQELRDFVPEGLWQADYREIGTQRVVIRPGKERASLRKALAQRLVDDFAASATQAEAIVNLHFPQGWEPYSTKALQRLLPQLEQGERFGALIAGPDFAKWRDENFPQGDQPTGEAIDRLPSPRGDRKATRAQREEAERIASVRNPTVVRVQNEMRKVVNNLIGLYGKPDLIRVELARDVGKSKREREEISKGMHKKEGMRKKARDDLNEKGRTNPSDDDVEKWLLWQECGRQCPYTGDPICFNDVFAGNPRFDIEHIWPKSKSLDNSFRNKTLCRKDINLAKGNQIPYEFFQGRPEDWQAAKDRVWKMVGKDGMNAGKARRFCSESMPDDFASRQLNDTGYAARQASEFLKRLWPDIGPTGDVHVQPVTGKVTAQLRRRWGLNHILAEDGEKTRAIAITPSKPSSSLAAMAAIRRNCRAISRRKANIKRDAAPSPRTPLSIHPGRTSGPTLSAPWPGLSYRIACARKCRGRCIWRRYTATPALTKKKRNAEPPSVRDPKTRRAPVERRGRGHCRRSCQACVIEWVAAHGGDPKKAFASFPRVSENGAEIRKVRLRSKQQLALMAPVSTGFADMSNNHHIAIYTNTAGDPNFEVVPLFEATKRLRDGKHGVLVHRHMEDHRFVMSLSPGDMIEIPDGERKGIWVVRKLSGNGQIFFKKSIDATPAGEGLWGPSPGPLLVMKARKISVDPIGRIRPAND